MIDKVLSPEVIVAVTVALTELAKNLGVPKKYLAGVAPLVGGISNVFAAYVSNMPVEQINDWNTFLIGSGWGAVATLLYAAGQSMTANKESSVTR